MKKSPGHESSSNKTDIIQIPYLWKNNKYLNFFQDNSQDLNFQYHKLSLFNRIFGIPKKIKMLHLNLCGTAYIDKFFVWRISNYVKHGGRLFTTLHNRIKKNEFKNYDKLLKLSDKILIHCEDSYEELKKLKSYNLFKSRIVLIPHPNYCNYIKYTSKNHRSMFNFKEDDIVFMFHGLIEKRKRIENLIDIFKNINNNNIHLLIVGNVTFFKKAYAKKLAALMKGIPNIHYRYGYIKDEEFNSWFNTSDIEIFTPNVNHQLNSASIMYSLSNKKTFISPDFGTVNSFKDKTFFFHFDSTSNNLHDSIIEIVNNIAKNYNRKKLLQMGEKAYEYVSKHNSIELFISELKEFYK